MKFLDLFRDWKNTKRMLEHKKKELEFGLLERELEDIMEFKRKQMFYLYCPIFKGNCNNGCIHFFGGRFKIGWWDNRPYACINDDPCCRLWKK